MRWRTRCRSSPRGCGEGAAEQFKVAVNLSFLSELDKLVPPSDASFGLDDRMGLEEREPPPWA